MSFWDIIWFIIAAYVFFAYLMVLFSLIADIFRNRETSGFHKAVWILLLIVLPILTVLVYLIANGSSMGDQDAAPPAGPRRSRRRRGRPRQVMTRQAGLPARRAPRSGGCGTRD
jgi:Phospholipase_D-nuclease N-terminal